MINKRVIVILGILIVFIGLCLIAFFSIKRATKTAIQLSAFPGNTHITIDGEDVKPGTIHLDPGTYRLEATMEGFDSQSRNIVLENTNQTVVVIMNPVTDEAMEYGRKNEAEYMKVAAAGERAAREAGTTFNERNPIAKYLPYKNFLYNVGYRMDKSDPSGNSIIIEIDASEGYRQAAIYRIRQLGFDPTDFTINFRDYENPFSL